MALLKSPSFEKFLAVSCNVFTSCASRLKEPAIKKQVIIPAVFFMVPNLVISA
jgi:hypothetical protein